MFARVVKTVTYVGLEDFEEKKMFGTLHIASDFFALWAKKLRASFRIFLSGLSKLPSSRPDDRQILFFPEKFCFLYKFLELEQFFLPPGKWAIWESWAKTAMHLLRGNICGNFTLKNCFFFNCLDFEQKNLDFQWKKYWHLCQNCSVSVRPKKIP